MHINPLILALAAEINATVVPARGANQAYLNGRWIGYYRDFGGWQIEPTRGAARIVVTREQAVAFAKDGELPAQAALAPLRTKDLAAFHGGEAPVVVIRKAAPKVEEEKEAPVQAETIALNDATMDLEALRDLKALRAKKDPVAAYRASLALTDATPEEVEVLVKAKFK